MPTSVIKRDGSKESFDAEKIRKAIAAACDDTGLEEIRKNEVVEQVTGSVLTSLGGLDEVATADLKQKILAELDRIEPSVSEAWQRYDREQKGLA